MKNYLSFFCFSDASFIVRKASSLETGCTFFLISLHTWSRALHAKGLNIFFSGFFISRFLFFRFHLSTALHELFSCHSACELHTLLKNFFRIRYAKRVFSFFRHPISLLSSDTKIARFYHVIQKKQGACYWQNLQNSFLISSFDALRAYKDRITSPSRSKTYFIGSDFPEKPTTTCKGCLSWGFVISNIWESKSSNTSSSHFVERTPSWWRSVIFRALWSYLNIMSTVIICLINHFKKSPVGIRTQISPLVSVALFRCATGGDSA